MKTNIVVVLIFASLLIQSSIFAQSQLTQAGDSESGGAGQFIFADIAGFPFNRTASESWQPYQSIRVGYGRKLGEHIEGRVCADYSWFDYNNSEHLTRFDYSLGKRRDISLYPAIVLFKFAEIALGSSYTTQDEVIHKVGLDGQTNPPQKVTIDPAVKKIIMYFHFSVAGTIHIDGPVGLSLGILVRSDASSSVMSIGCRTGLKYAL